MKKVLLLSLFIGGTILLSSCKKSYTCSCTTVDSSGFVPTTTELSTIVGTKRKVKEQCEDASFKAVTFTVTCELK